MLYLVNFTNQQLSNIDVWALDREKILLNYLSTNY